MLFRSLDTKRFDGRSAFFMPPAPGRKPPKPVKPPEPPKPPPPPPPPSAPREYTGPKPVGAIGNLVFFADSSQIKVGEERGGVKVLASAAPWSVKLAHAGGEYDVPLWSKGKEEFFNGDWGSLKGTVPGIQPVPSSGGAPAPSPSATTTSGGAGMPGMRSGPGMGPAPSAPAVPASAPAAPEAAASGATTPPPPPASDARNPWTAEHMAPPPPVSPETIAGMSRADVQAAMQAVSRARMNRNLDDPTRERLNQEFQQLSNRMNELTKGQSGPG